MRPGGAAGALTREDADLRAAWPVAELPRGVPPGPVIGSPFVEYRWDAAEAGALGDELALLVYLSNLVGADGSLTQPGGGNSSLKRRERDFAGREAEVLRVKGSGTDMATIGAAGFCGLRLDGLAELRRRDRMSDEEMLAFMRATMLDAREPAPSVETPLHSVLPFRFVVHTHDFATQALTDTPRPEALVREALRGEAAYVDYLRPGFPLARGVMDLGPLAPGARGLVLGRHGLIAWGDSARDCYDNLYRLIDARRALRRRAPRQPALRGAEGGSAGSGAAARRSARAAAPRARGTLARAAGDPAPRRLGRGAGLRGVAAGGGARAAGDVHARAHPALRPPAAGRRCRPRRARAGRRRARAGDCARAVRGRVPRGLRAQRHAGADARPRAQGGAAAGPRSRDRDEGQGGRTGREPLLPARHARDGGGGGARRLPLPRRGGRLRVRVLAPRAGQARPTRTRAVAPGRPRDRRRERHRARRRRTLRRGRGAPGPDRHRGRRAARDGRGRSPPPARTPIGCAPSRRTPLAPRTPPRR